MLRRMSLAEEDEAKIGLKGLSLEGSSAVFGQWAVSGV